MKKCIRNTKFLRKLVVSKPINSIAFNGASIYAKLLLDRTTNLFDIHISSIGSYNKLLTMRITKTGKNKNLCRKVREENVEVISFSLTTLSLIN